MQGDARRHPRGLPVSLSISYLRFTMAHWDRLETSRASCGINPGSILEEAADGGDSLPPMPFSDS